MNNITKRDKLLNLMQEAKGNSLDIYYVIYEEFLKNDESPSELLRDLLEFASHIGEDDGASEKVSDKVVRETTQNYENFLMETVALLAGFNDPVDEFYKKLWDSVFQSSTSPKKNDQCAVILKVLREDSPLLPYYQAIGLLPMEDSEFSERVKHLKPRIIEAIHMLNRHFPQGTEETSQLCRLAQDLSSEDACVYWTTIFDVVKKSAFHAGRVQAALAEKNTEIVSDRAEKPML